MKLILLLLLTDKEWSSYVIQVLMVVKLVVGLDIDEALNLQQLKNRT